MIRGSIRPGGRTERVRQAVAAAVLDFIKEGRADFAMQDVAERSGIARSTLYARWPTRDHLIAEALRANNSVFQLDKLDDWREHIRHVARAFRDFSARPDEIAINALAARLGSGFLAEETYRQWRSIAVTMAEPLRDAQAAGAIRPDVDPIVVISTLFASIAGLIVIAKDVPSDAYLDQLADLLIAGCEPVPAAS